MNLLDAQKEGKNEGTDNCYYRQGNSKEARHFLQKKSQCKKIISGRRGTSEVFGGKE